MSRGNRLEYSRLQGRWPTLPGRHGRVCASPCRPPLQRGIGNGFITLSLVPGNPATGSEALQLLRSLAITTRARDRTTKRYCAARLGERTTGNDPSAQPITAILS